MEYGYARVSTKEQNELRQLIALREFGLTDRAIFVDKQSGKDFDRPNYKKLVKNKCDLALLSSGILPKKGSSKKAARKKMKAYQKMTEKMTLLEMPVIVDRSKDEKGKDAKKEWEKVYQVILGCEDQSAE